MRKLILLLIVAGLAGCVVRASPGVNYGPVDPYAPPGYLYSYSDGTCWADGVLYGPPCPWNFGPSYGYYYWWSGHYYYAPHRSWGYRPGHPPPYSWRGERPRVRDHRVHPPRVRDHRDHPPRPRGRDHRRRR